jgi:hypothetical protein
MQGVLRFIIRGNFVSDGQVVNILSELMLMLSFGMLFCSVAGSGFFFNDPLLETESVKKQISAAAMNIIAHFISKLSSARSYWRVCP